MRVKFVFLGLVLSACAQSPDMIAPAYVSPMNYTSWSCTQIAEEQARLNGALAVASQQQHAARANDTAAVIFLGLPLASMTGANIAPQIARYKGEQEATRLASISRSCDREARLSTVGPVF